MRTKMGLVLGIWLSLLGAQGQPPQPVKFLDTANTGVVGEWQAGAPIVLKLRNTTLTEVTANLEVRFSNLNGEEFTDSLWTQPAPGKLENRSVVLKALQTKVLQMVPARPEELDEFLRANRALSGVVVAIPTGQNLAPAVIEISLTPAPRPVLPASLDWLVWLVPIVFGIMALIRIATAVHRKWSERTMPADFDSKATWITNASLGTGLLTSIGAFSVAGISDGTRTQYAIIAGVFTLLLFLGPTIYRLTQFVEERNPKDNEPVQLMSNVGYFITSTTLTLIGTFGILLVVGLLLMDLSQTKLLAPIVAYIALAVILIVCMLLVIFIGPAAALAIHGLRYGMMIPEPPDCCEKQLEVMDKQTTALKGIAKAVALIAGEKVETIQGEVKELLDAMKAEQAPSEKGFPTTKPLKRPKHRSSLF